MELRIKLSKMERVKIFQDKCKSIHWFPKSIIIFFAFCMLCFATIGLKVAYGVN